MQNRLKTAFIAILFAAYLSAGQKRREEKIWEEEMLQINLHYYRYDDNYSGWYLWLRADRGNSLMYEFDKNDNFGGIVTCSIKIVKGITNIGFMIRHADQGTSWDMREICSERFIDITHARNGFLDLYVIHDESEIEYWRPEMLQTNPSNNVIASPTIHMTSMNTSAFEEPVNQPEIQSISFIQSNKLAKTFTNDIQIIDKTESNDNEICKSNINDIKLDEENICALELDHMKIVESKIDEKKISNKNIGDRKISSNDVITNEIKTDNAKTDNAKIDNEKTVYAKAKETETNIIIMDDAGAQDVSFSNPAKYRKCYRTSFHLLLIISAMVVVAVTFLILQVCNIM
jgi:Bacterial pullanase-associated domain.